MLRKYVGFSLDKGRYAIPVDSVVQIIRYEQITAVPTAPAYVKGVMNMRGEVIPIITIRERFGLPDLEPTRKNRIIVISCQNKSYGLLVDSVRELIELEEQEIEEAATASLGLKAQLVHGIAKVGADLLLVLDIDQILASA